MDHRALATMMKKKLHTIILLLFANLAFAQNQSDTIMLGDSLKMILSPELKATLNYAEYMDSLVQQNKNSVKVTSENYWESGQIKVMYDQDLKGGLADYNKALDIDSTNSKVYNDRAFVYLLLNDTLRALEDYNRAIFYNDSISALFSNRASLYFEMDEMEKAQNDIDKAIKLNSQSGSNYYLKGKIFFSIKEYKQSILQFERVLELSPSTIGSFHWLGLNYLELGKVAKACKYFYKALGHNYGESKKFIEENCE